MTPSSSGNSIDSDAPLESWPIFDLEYTIERTSSMEYVLVQPVTGNKSIFSSWIVANAATAVPLEEIP
jgi:hypothetical protein